MSATLPENPGESTDALPHRWVGRIFDELATTYGSKFSQMWEGIDPEAVRITWARKLSGFLGQPECIRAALDSCDDRPWPPTLPEFIGLCRDAARRGGPKQLALPAPEIDRVEQERRAREAVASVQKPESYDWLAWARKLRDRYLSGEHLIDCQIRIASEALCETWGSGQCGPRTETA